MVMERYRSGELKNIFRVNFHKYFYCSDDRWKACLAQEEERKGDISIALMIHE